MRRPASSTLPSFSGATSFGSSPPPSPSPARGSSVFWRWKWWLLFYLVLAAYGGAVVASFAFGWVPRIPHIATSGGTRPDAVRTPQEKIVTVAVNKPIVDQRKVELLLQDADLAAQQKGAATSAPTKTADPRSPVERSSEFEQALALVHLPETPTPHPYFHVFPVPTVATDDPKLLSGLRSHAIDRDEWTVEAHEQEVERLRRLQKEAKQETARLKLLADAADKLIAQENDEMEEKRARNTLDIRVHQPRVIRDKLKCLGWRQTGACSPFGKREPGEDRACNQIAKGGVSGYCEMLDEDTGERFRVMQLNCSSVRDHVVFSCAQAADFANFGLRAQQVYEDALKQNASVPSPLLGSVGSGDGIVMVVYPKLLTSVYASISVLRSYGCTLPIELWVSQPEVARTPTMKPTLDLLQERFSNVTVETITDPTVAGFSTKIHAVHHSKFENVLFLDADNVPVRDPTYLFASREFREHGAVFWPDFWHPEKTIFNIQRDSLLWELVDLPFVDMFEQESGQILLNRKRAAVALEVVMFFAYHRPSHFERLVLAHGDKDLFRLAWMKTSTPYYMIPFPPASAGTVRGTFKKQYCGMTMVQFDADGEVLFLHRNAKKLHGKVDEMDSKYWTHLQTFNREVAGSNVGDSDVGSDERRPATTRTPRTAVERLMDYEDIKTKYIIGIQASGVLFKEFESCYGAEAEAVANFNLTKFEELPFAGLEQQLTLRDRFAANEFDRCHPLALVLFSNSSELLDALAAAVASALFGSTRSPHTVQAVDFQQLLEPPRASNYDIKQTLRSALATPLRTCAQRSLFVLQNVQALDDAALPVLDVFLDPLNGKRAQFQQHVEGGASHVLDCTNSVFLFLYQVTSSHSPLDGAGANWREFLMQQWTRSEGTMEEFTPQAFVGRLTEAVAVFPPEGEEADADGDAKDGVKRSREWRRTCELLPSVEEDDANETDGIGETFAAAAAFSLTVEEIISALTFLAVPAFFLVLYLAMCWTRETTKQREMYGAIRHRRRPKRKNKK
ncbi:hypothetical protein BBJ28_00018279 [Nothophytophthora sp. Chile5]|nr:hypothetical protein BBJ28_00018279 [Nothophytophthora sp. Chile5]